MTHANNIILTGVPRSGTTLTCHLLNKLPDVVALHEPMSPDKLIGCDERQILSAVQAFFIRQRRLILTEGQAESKGRAGVIPSNPLSDLVENGQRVRLTDRRSRIQIDDVTDEGFSLYIKHPAFFTACLAILMREFPCLAVVRNPLSVLLSWRNSGGMPVSRGRAPMAEHFAPALAETLAGEADVLERQFALLNWYFGQYADCIPERVLKYEHIVDSGGQALSAINKMADSLNEPLFSRNRFSLKSDPEARPIAEKLLSRRNACWHFYQPGDVEELFEESPSR